MKRKTLLDCVKQTCKNYFSEEKKDLIIYLQSLQTYHLHRLLWNKPEAINLDKYDFCSTHVFFFLSSFFFLFYLYYFAYCSSNSVLIYSAQPWATATVLGDCVGQQVMLGAETGKALEGQRPLAALAASSSYCLESCRGNQTAYIDITMGTQGNMWRWLSHWEAEGQRRKAAFVSGKFLCTRTWCTPENMRPAKQRASLVKLLLWKG